MGNLYIYKCKNCQSEIEYKTGGGFFTSEYFEETEKLTNQFKDEALSGKYGKIIKAIAENNDGNIEYNRNTKLFRCNECKAVNVLRAKEISNFPYIKSEYSLSVKISVQCPECHKGIMETVNLFEPIWCEKCQDYSSELISFGFWD